jgi:hypothetical protein
MNETKTRIDEHLGDAIMTGDAVTQKRRYIVARYIRAARGSEVCDPDRWELRAELNPYCLRADAVFDYIRDIEHNAVLADALAEADWNGRRPIIVECADGYTIELAVAEVSIELV